MPVIKLHPSGKVIDIINGVPFRDALISAGFDINSPCGGMGLCGKCRIKLIDGEIRGDIDDDGYFLSCKSFPLTDCEIEFSEAENKRMKISNRDPRQGLHDIAIDLGTTTVVGAIVSRATRGVVAVISVPNPQAVHGDDVISRISYASTPSGLAALSSMIDECVDDLIYELCVTACDAVGCARDIVISGNSTMVHLYMAVSPASLGQTPFSPAFRTIDDIEKLPPGKYSGIILLPNIAGFIGGDTVSGIFATELYKSEKPKLFIDIGTNGEVVIGNKDRIIATSAAAGPAFEGARIECGMHAGPGAINHVTISEGSVSFTTIDGVRPVGICGSGLFEVVGAMLNTGLINSSGKFTDPQIGNKFYLTVPDASEKIYISEKDISELQLAKGAIRAAVEILLDEFGIGMPDIDEIIVAGAFGFYLRPDDITAIGLLPDFDQSKLTFAGNTSLKGAIDIVTNKPLTISVLKLADSVEFIELASKPRFQEIFTDSLLFHP